MRVLLIQPEAQPYETELSFATVNGVTRAVVPQLNVWAMVIVDGGTFTPPTTPPSYTETPDPVQVAAGRGTVGQPVTDPLAPPGMTSSCKPTPTALGRRIPGITVFGTSRSPTPIKPMIRPSAPTMGSHRYAVSGLT